MCAHQSDRITVSLSLRAFFFNGLRACGRMCVCVCVCVCVHPFCFSLRSFDQHVVTLRLLFLFLDSQRQGTRRTELFSCAAGKKLIAHVFAAPKSRVSCGGCEWKGSGVARGIPRRRSRHEQQHLGVWACGCGKTAFTQDTISKHRPRCTVWIEHGSKWSNASYGVGFFVESCGWLAFRQFLGREFGVTVKGSMPKPLQSLPGSYPEYARAHRTQ